MTTFKRKHKIYQSPRVKIEELPKAHFTSETVGNIQVQKERFLKHGKTPVFVIQGDTASVEELTAKVSGQIRFDYLGEAEYILRRVRDQYGVGENYLDHIYGPRISQSEANTLLMDYINENSLRESLDVFWSHSMTCSARLVWRGLNNKCNKPELRRYSLWVNGTEENPYLRRTGFVCLMDHEIGTHFFRTFNDGLQPWFSDKKKFDLRSSYSFEGLCTEEGLAAIHTALRAGEQYLWLAALVYYTACKSTEMTFRQLFDHLGQFVSNREQRWKHCMRVKRGLVDPNDLGGYGKDQCYFEGAVNILRNIDNIDFSLLMSGKICYDEVNRIKRVARMNCVRLPAFMRDMQAYVNQLKQMAFVNGLHLPHPKYSPSPAYLHRLAQRQAGVKRRPRKVRRKRGSHASVSKTGIDKSTGDMGSEEGSTDAYTSESQDSVLSFNMDSLLLEYQERQRKQELRDQQDDVSLSQTPTGGMAQKIGASIMNSYQAKPDFEVIEVEKQRDTLPSMKSGVTDRNLRSMTPNILLSDRSATGDSRKESGHPGRPTLSARIRERSQMVDKVLEEINDSMEKFDAALTERPLTADSKRRPEKLTAVLNPRTVQLIQKYEMTFSTSDRSSTGALQDSHEISLGSGERFDDVLCKVPADSSTPATPLPPLLDDFSSNTTDGSDRTGMGLFNYNISRVWKVVSEYETDPAAKDEAAGTNTSVENADMKSSGSTSGDDAVERSTMPSAGKSVKMATVTRDDSEQSAGNPGPKLDANSKGRLSPGGTIGKRISTSKPGKVEPSGNSARPSTCEPVKKSEIVNSARPSTTVPSKRVESQSPVPPVRTSVASKPNTATSQRVSVASVTGKVKPSVSKSNKLPVRRSSTGDLPSSSRAPVRHRPSTPAEVQRSAEAPAVVSDAPDRSEENGKTVASKARLSTGDGMNRSQVRRTVRLLSAGAMPKSSASSTVRPSSAGALPKSAAKNVRRPASAHTLSKPAVTRVGRPSAASALPKSDAKNVVRPSSAGTLTRSEASRIIRLSAADVLPKSDMSSIVTPSTTQPASAEVLTKSQAVDKVKPSGDTLEGDPPTSTVSPSKNNARKPKSSKSSAYAPQKQSRTVTSGSTASVDAERGGMKVTGSKSILAKGGTTLNRQMRRQHRTTTVRQVGRQNTKGKNTLPAGSTAETPDAASAVEPHDVETGKESELKNEDRASYPNPMETKMAASPTRKPSIGMSITKAVITEGAAHRRGTDSLGRSFMGNPSKRVRRGVITSNRNTMQKATVTSSDQTLTSVHTDQADDKESDSSTITDDLERLAEKAFASLTQDSGKGDRGSKVRKSVAGHHQKKSQAPRRNTFSTNKRVNVTNNSRPVSATGNSKKAKVTQKWSQSAVSDATQAESNTPRKSLATRKKMKTGSQTTTSTAATLGGIQASVPTNLSTGKVAKISEIHGTGKISQSNSLGTEEVDKTREGEPVATTPTIKTQFLVSVTDKPLDTCQSEQTNTKRACKTSVYAGTLPVLGNGNATRAKGFVGKKRMSTFRGMLNMQNLPNKSVTLKLSRKIKPGQQQVKDCMPGGDKLSCINSSPMDEGSVCGKHSATDEMKKSEPRFVSATSTSQMMKTHEVAKTGMQTTGETSQIIRTTSMGEDLLVPPTLKNASLTSQNSLTLNDLINMTDCLSTPRQSEDKSENAAVGQNCMKRTNVRRRARPHTAYHMIWPKTTRRPFSRSAALKNVSAVYLNSDTMKEDEIWFLNQTTGTCTSRNAHEEGEGTTGTPQLSTSTATNNTGQLEKLISRLFRPKSPDLLKGFSSRPRSADLAIHPVDRVEMRGLSTPSGEISETSEYEPAKRSDGVARHLMGDRQEKSAESHLTTAANSSSLWKCPHATQESETEASRQTSVSKSTSAMQPDSESFMSSVGNLLEYSSDSLEPLDIKSMNLLSPLKRPRATATTDRVFNGKTVAEIKATVAKELQKSMDEYLEWREKVKLGIFRLQMAKKHFRAKSHCKRLRAKSSHKDQQEWEQSIDAIGGNRKACGWNSHAIGQIPHDIQHVCEGTEQVSRSIQEHERVGKVPKGIQPESVQARQVPERRNKDQSMRGRQTSQGHKSDYKVWAKPETVRQHCDLIGLASDCIQPGKLIPIHIPTSGVENMCDAYLVQVTPVSIGDSGISAEDTEGKGISTEDVPSSPMPVHRVSRPARKRRKRKSRSAIK